MHVFVSQFEKHIRIGYRMPHGFRKFCEHWSCVQQVCIPKGWVGGRLGSSDAHHDGRINSLSPLTLSPGINYEYSEITLTAVAGVFYRGLAVT